MNELVVFQKIRKIWNNNEWYFSVIDVIEILTGSSIPRRYWSDLKIKLKEEGFELYEKIVQLKLQSSDGKYYATDCANTETLFRLIQSIPSPRAEPFKLWLAKVGYERVQEIENPELAQKRTREIYKQKGYSDDWIEKRVRGIAVRDELTDEWKKRDVKTDREFAILTSEISKATFDMTPSQYKKLKSLNRENLRDHMTDLELIFNMLGERVTTEVTRAKAAKGIKDCKVAAKEGGEVAGNARKDAEKRVGRTIISEENFLDEPEKKKRLPKS